MNDTKNCGSEAGSPTEWKSPQIIILYQDDTKTGAIPDTQENETFHPS